MMPRKKRRMIILLSAMVLLLIIAVAFLLCYIYTDIFKTNSTLFTKYIGQNIENMEAVYNDGEISDYNELLKQNKCTTQSQVKVNYTENMGTSSENTQNSVNQLKLEINGQTDKSNQYNYQNIQLMNHDEKIAKTEYIQNGITYGIRFSDLFNQYILVDNQNLKDLFRKMEYSDEQIENIPDTVEFENSFKNILGFSEEEKQTLKTKYSSIMNDIISNDNFSKQKNQTIEINGKKLEVNAYVLTMTKEQLNNIYIKLLEEIKQDEIILKRIDKLQEILQDYQFSETINVKQEFVSEVENLITDITKNNIGQEQVKIIVYENNKTTVRTTIQHPDYEINIDVLAFEAEKYMQVTYQNTKTKKEQNLTYKKTKEETNMTFSNEKDEETTQYSFLITQKVEGNQGIKNITIQYKDDSNKMEVTIEKKINKVDYFENQVVLNNENSINLNGLEAEQLQVILNKVNSSLTEKINQLTMNNIKTEDLLQIMKMFGLATEQEDIEATGITETEKIRFNSQFEMLQGENLEGTNVLELINAIQENLVDLEVVSNTEIKLKLDRLNKNQEVTDTLKNFIEQNKEKKYNAKIEYEEDTGLVSDILLTMLEK